jgi:hypothetical protein
MTKIRNLVLLFALTAAPHSLFAQASLVPVYHGVYDWLHYQRVRGNAPLYNYEALPLTRGQITRLLKDMNPTDLSRGDNHVRSSYLREFSVDSLRKYEDFTLIQGEDKIYNRLRDLIFSDEEPHVYVWDDENATIAFDWFPGRGAVFVTDGENKFSSPYYTIGGIRSYGTFWGLLGYHFEQWRAVQVGDSEAFSYLPFLSRNAKFLRPSGSTPNKHHLENFVGLQYRYLSLHIGRGTLKYGVGDRNNLSFSRESIPFDWVRLNINSKYFKYSAIYGGLSWEPGQRNTPLEGYPGEYTRVSPQRWVVHHRFQFQPAHWITFGFYETNLFSNRPLDLAFINPVNNLSIMEWEQYDKGNGFAGFEGTLRPLLGLELFGEILIDDLGDAKDIFRWEKQKAANSTFGRQLGLRYAFIFGTQLSVDYQRMEPAIYSHKYILNSYVEKGFSLGSQVGPNGDELSFGLTQWLSHRTKVAIRYDYNRQGLNYFDDNGEFVDVGGDILESYKLDENLRPFKPSVFLAGDLHRWDRYTIEATYQPWRGITLTAEYSLRNMLQGTQLDDLSIFNFTFLIAN